MTLRNPVTPFLTLPVTGGATPKRLFPFFLHSLTLCNTCSKSWNSPLRRAASELELVYKQTWKCELKYLPPPHTHNREVPWCNG